MKILHLTTHLNTGGITTYILRLIRPLKDRGIETYVLSSGGECRGQFTERGAKVFDLPIKTKSELHPKIYLQLPAVAKLIRDENIDLIHAHTRITQVMAAWLKYLTGRPYVATFHGFYRRRLGRRLWPCFGEGAIAISEGVRDHLVKDHFFSIKKVWTVNNAVDLDEIDQTFQRHDPAKVRAHFGLSPNDKVIGVVARLVQDKVHEFLIRAVGELRHRYKGLKILIVGEGNYRAALEKLARDLNLSSQVIFTGRQPDVTLPLAAIDIFSLPATWREGFGLSIIEAMTCGKPVIVTNIWALNSLIQNRITGLMVPPSAVEPLAEAIAELIDNQALSATMQRAGRAMVERLFSISRMADEIAAIYRSVPRNALTGSPAVL